MTISENNVLLFKVKEQFVITGRGLILTPGLGDKVKLVTTGTRIKLIRPDQTELLTTIKGIAFEGTHDILISEEFTKEDVPVDTEVWTNE